MTQTALGQAAFRVSTSAAQTRITRIENGSVSVADEDIESLATVLGVPVAELSNLPARPNYLPDTQTVDTEYPQLQSLYALLTLAVERDDSFLRRQALKALQDFAEQELSLLDDHSGSADQ